MGNCDVCNLRGGSISRRKIGNFVVWQFCNLFQCRSRLWNRGFLSTVGSLETLNHGVDGGTRGETLISKLLLCFRAIMLWCGWALTVVICPVGQLRLPCLGNTPKDVARVDRGNQVCYG